MPIPNRPKSQNQYSEQDIANSSLDEAFGVPVVEILTYNPISDSLERVTDLQGNDDLTLAYDASGNPITLTKVVGSATYSKTLTWDSNGNLTNMSVWT